jgi:hypothetical protein
MNYFVTLENGTVVQVGGVTKITIISPLVANGTYRDTPPPVTGSAAGSTGSSVATINGGVDITFSGAFVDTLIGNSSIDEDDRYAHVDLRFVFGPIAFVSFTTENVIASVPVEADFPMARPTTNFKVVEADCLWKLDEVKGWSNIEPPGFVVATYTPPTP